MRDCYDTIWRFPTSEKGSWLRGLLKETGHVNFVLSGPWNSSGEPLGVFGNSLEAFHLLLKSDGPSLVLRQRAYEQTLADRQNVERLVPLPVAQKFAEDLRSEALWATLRRSLQVEQISPKHAPPPTPRGN
jgi:hypothetical protein